MLLLSFESDPNLHSATRTPIPTELLNNWQKRVGKKGARSTIYTSPSPIIDSDSDSDVTPLGPIIKYTTRSSLAALPAGDASNVAGPSTDDNNVAGPSTRRQSNGTQERSNRNGVEVIEIEGTSFHRCSVSLLNKKIPDYDSLPSPTQRRTASPTMGTIENLNTSFSGSFYVDESLKDLNPWDASAVNETWDF